MEKKTKKREQWNTKIKALVIEAGMKSAPRGPWTNMFTSGMSPEGALVSAVNMVNRNKVLQPKGANKVHKKLLKNFKSKEGVTKTDSETATTSRPATLIVWTEKGIIRFISYNENSTVIHVKKDNKSDYKKVGNYYSLKDAQKFEISATISAGKLKFKNGRKVKVTEKAEKMSKDTLEEVKDGLENVLISYAKMDFEVVKKLIPKMIKMINKEYS